MRVDGSLIVLFFSVFSTFAALPFLAAFGATPMTPAQIAIMTGAGCGGAIGQFGVTAAYRYAQPRQIAPLDYLNVVFTAVFGFFLFGQVPDVLSVVGFAAIVVAALRSTHAPAHRRDVTA
jgi:drug/metabolite transporter (DMT)-like permease